MRRNRIFIAINLPENIKNNLAEYQEKRPDLPIRWVKKENLHITLMFLGYLSDEELLEILKITKEVTSRHQPFSINLKKIIYGPPKKMPPRMIWVEGEKSGETGKLQSDLENSLLVSPIKDLDGEENKSSSSPFATARVVDKAAAVSPPFARLRLARVYENRPYTPHITLGRIMAWEFRQIEPEERPEVNEEINLEFDVNSVEVMESNLKRGGAEYTILETCNLKLET